MLRAGLSALAFAVALAACATFPELDAVISDGARKADYPTLIPVDGILVRRASGQITEQTDDILRARAANLQARANLLRGIVVDDETRRRLSARLERLGG